MGILPSERAAPPVHEFRVFVTGESRRSVRALENLRRLCTTHLGERWALEVVDVMSDPARAEADRVMATPTTIRVSPRPERRLVGDLSDLGAAAAALELTDPPSDRGNRRW